MQKNVGGTIVSCISRRLQRPCPIPATAIAGIIPLVFSGTRTRHLLLARGRSLATGGWLWGGGVVVPPSGRAAGLGEVQESPGYLQMLGTPVELRKL